MEAARAPRLAPVLLEAFSRPEKMRHLRGVVRRHGQKADRPPLALLSGEPDPLSGPVFERGEPPGAVGGESVDPRAVDEHPGPRRQLEDDGQVADMVVVGVAGEDRLDLRDGDAREPMLDRPAIHVPAAEEDLEHAGVREVRSEEDRVLAPAQVETARPEIADLHLGVLRRYRGSAGHRTGGMLEIEGLARMVRGLPEDVATPRAEGDRGEDTPPQPPPGISFH